MRISYEVIQVYSSHRGHYLDHGTTGILSVWYGGTQNIFKSTFLYGTVLYDCTVPDTVIYLCFCFSFFFPLFIERDASRGLRARSMSDRSFTTKGLPFGWKLRESRSRPGWCTTSRRRESRSGLSPRASRSRPPGALRSWSKGSRARGRGAAAGASADSGKRASFPTRCARHTFSSSTRGRATPSHGGRRAPLCAARQRRAERLAALRKQIVDSVGDGVGGDGDNAADAWERRRAAFAKVAETESDCSSHKHGGDLRFFSYDRMDPPFSAAAFALEPFAISDIVQGASGLHIILRTDDPSLPSEVHCLHLLKSIPGLEPVGGRGCCHAHERDGSRARRAALCAGRRSGGRRCCRP